MSDDYTQLNQGMGGDVMDETGVRYPSGPPVRKRPRLVLTGEQAAEIASVANHAPVGDEYGLIVRNIPSPPGTSVIHYGEITAVPSHAEISTISYTVPPGMVFSFTGFTASGQFACKYKIYLNTNVIFCSRTTAADLNSIISFQNAVLPFPENTIISLRVTHSEDGFQGEFEGTLLGHNLPVT